MAYLIRVGIVGSSHESGILEVVDDVVVVVTCRELCHVIIAVHPWLGGCLRLCGLLLEIAVEEQLISRHLLFCLAEERLRVEGQHLLALFGGLHDGATGEPLTFLGVLVDKLVQECHHGKVLHGITAIVDMLRAAQRLGEYLHAGMVVLLQLSLPLVSRWSN